MSAEHGSLLPCPFCGNDKHDSWDGVRMRQQEITENGYGVPLRERERLFYVFCGSCGARGGIGQSGSAANGLFVTEEQARSIAARKWNQRGGEMYADD